MAVARSLCQAVKEQKGFVQIRMWIQAEGDAFSPADSTLTLNSKFVMEHNEAVASGLQFARCEDNRCAALISVLCVY